MKKLACTLNTASFVFLFASLPAFCEEHDHCLHHHWLSPEYVGEMRLQGVAIGLGTVLWGVILLIGKLKHAR